MGLRGRQPNATDGRLIRTNLDTPGTITGGGVAERTNAAVLKTVEARASVGSNPTPSAKEWMMRRGLAALAATLTLTACGLGLPNPTIGPSPPPGGISATEAVELARASAKPSSGPESVASMSAGEWSSLAGLRGEAGPGSTRWVWRIVFRGAFDDPRCSPAGAICPRTTCQVVVLDYLTGNGLWRSSC